MPDGVHTFDMLEYNGEWFAALGCYSNTIVSSTNGGATWQGALSPNLATVGNTGERVYSLFQLGGTLYSMTRVLLPNHNLAPTLLRYNTNAGFFVTNSPASSYALTNFCPNTSIPYDQDYCIARTTNVGDKLVYILGLVTNDMQWDPMGLYWATNVSGGTKVNLPSGTKPWDIMQNSNGVWVLEASPVSGSSDFWVQVVGTQDFVNWSEVLRFRSSTFARSFGQLDGDLYFGLGCETNSLSTNTGAILRVESQYFSQSPAPTVTWTTPAAVVYGTALNSNQLNATANVPDSFVYNPANGAELNAGTNILSVVFTPTVVTTNTTVKASVSLVVLPAPLTVTASNASCAYDQAIPPLSGEITGLQNGDKITATYSCRAFESCPAGTYPITPSLVDPQRRLTNYTVTLVNGTLTITKTGLAVTWTTPAAVVYGTTLNSNQLNATANVPGSFVYSPTNGAALNAGTNALSVTFTPTDTRNYSTVQTRVLLVVLPVPLGALLAAQPASRAALRGATSITLQFSVAPSTTYMLQASTDLKAWKNIARFTSAKTDSVYQFTQPLANGPQARFYRLTSQ